MEPQFELVQKGRLKLIEGINIFNHSFPYGDCVDRALAVNALGKCTFQHAITCHLAVAAMDGAKRCMAALAIEDTEIAKMYKESGEDLREKLLVIGRDLEGLSRLVPDAPTITNLDGTPSGPSLSLFEHAVMGVAKTLENHMAFEPHGWETEANMCERAAEQLYEAAAQMHLRAQQTTRALNNWVALALLDHHQDKDISPISRTGPVYCRALGDHMRFLRSSLAA